MDKIGRGIAYSTNYDNPTKEQLFESLFQNPDQSLFTLETLRVLLDWVLVDENELLVKMGHRYFRELSNKNPSLFFEIVGPKFAVDLYLNNNYINKKDILLLTQSLLDILKSNHEEFEIPPTQPETERAIINIIKCRIPLFIKHNGLHASVLASAQDLLTSYPILLPSGQQELSKLIIVIVELVAGYKYHESHLGEYQKIGGLFGFLISLCKDSMKDALRDVLKTLYTIVYSSDLYDQPSPCLMFIFDKIPAPVLRLATEYFVNDSRNPQGEARVVGALQTLISWLSCIPNPSISLWVSSLLEALKQAGRYPVLVELTHSSIEKLCYTLSDPSVSPSIEKIFFFLLMGFQHSEITFHRLIAPLRQVLERISESEEFKDLQESLIEAIFYFVRLFPNYPGLYEPLLTLLKKRSFKSLEEERYYELRKLSWIDKAETPESTSSSRVSMLGLLNLGNTCYMNSILQSLFLTKQFTDSILKSPVTASQIVLHRLQMVFAFLRLSLRSYYSPGDFLKVGRPPWFEPGRQQDCSEFLRYLLDTLHETEKHCRKNMSSSAFVDKFGRDMSENLRSYSTSALNSIEENDQEPDAAVQENETTPTFEIGGSISNFCPKNPSESDSDFNMGSSMSLQSNLIDMRRWTTHENLSLTEEEELTEEENDSGIQSVVDSISGSSDSMQQSEEFLSTVQRVFGGVLQNSYECKNCRSISKRKENFTDINLALPNEPTSSRPLSVQTLLDNFLKVELLEGENKYHCESCKGLQEAEKSAAILESPSHLTCTLLRFHYDREAKRRSKIFTEIAYEKTLKLPSKEGEEVDYDLYCVVLHSGYGSDSGHYYCYGRKTEDASTWYNFNDSHVSTVSFDTFQERSRKFPRDTPYVLMYQKRTPPAPLSDPDKPLRPDLKAAVEKDNRAYLMDLDRSMLKSLSNSSSHKNFNPRNNEDDDDDDNHGLDPSRSCHAGGKFDSFGGGRFIF